VLADLGYFGFRWFDELTEHGYHWVSRIREKTSLIPVHTLYQDDAVTDELVWLGKYRAVRARHLVRLVSVRRGAAMHQYLTNVTDPRQMSAAEVVAVYGDRWTIEQAFKVVKRELGLHLLWSAKPAVVEAQVWAVLLIAQVIAAIRGELAAQAEVAIAEVSVPLLIETLPALAARHADPFAILLAEARRFHIIRPPRRIPRTIPPVDLERYSHPPPDLVTTRLPRYFDGPSIC
jgi:Transposase DDE domain